MNDPITKQMQQETNHDCIACPTEIRNLTATVHNALSQWDSSPPDWSRMSRKMESMREALALLKIIVDEHFEELEKWRRP